MSRGYRKNVFSTREELLLIQKVKENPALYAQNLISNKNRSLKDSLWEKIAKELGPHRTIDQCKKRWRNIRDYYWKARRKEVENSKSPDCDEDHKLRRLRFLEGFYQGSSEIQVGLNGSESLPGARGSSMEDSGDSLSRYKEQEEDSEPEIDKATILQQDIAEDQFVEAESDSDAKADDPVATRTRGNPSRKKKSRSEVVREPETSISSQKNQPGSSTEYGVADDHIDLFFMSLAATAKTFLPLHLVEAKRILFSAMSEIEYKDMKLRNAESHHQESMFASVGDCTDEEQNET